jgi:hypothetical protein
MNKKNEKHLCWNCEGNVSHHIAQCPYCGVDVTQPAPPRDENAIFKGFASPFQSAPKQDIPKPPYSTGRLVNPKKVNESSKEAPPVTEEEWNSALNENQETTPEEELPLASKKELVALLLLLPGVVFFLFGLALILFSNQAGVLVFQWNRNVAYFYFLGALPLLYLGWRVLGR